MNKNVLIIKGSPRTKGNTATMADIFAKGAIENHNAVTEIVLKDKTIIDCSGCAICQQNGGKCVQDDDNCFSMSGLLLYLALFDEKND